MMSFISPHYNDLGLMIILIFIFNRQIFVFVCLYLSYKKKKNSAQTLIVPLSDRRADLKVELIG